MTPRALVLSLLVFGGLAAPAPAAQVSGVSECYASAGPTPEEREDVVVSGTDFTPLASVEVLVDGLLVRTAPTGSIGEFRTYADAPYQPRGERTFTVTVRDGADPGVSFTLLSRVTDLAVTLQPRRAAPWRRVRFRGRGFMRRGTPVFAHYLFEGEEKRTVRLARRTNGPCGRFAAKRRQIPVAHPRAGRWIVQVDQRRAYSPEPDPVWVRVPIEVTRFFLEP